LYPMRAPLGDDLGELYPLYPLLLLLLLLVGFRDSYLYDADSSV
jgi:hypothetical protein